MKASSAARRKRRKSKPLQTNEEIRQVLRKHLPELADGTLEMVSIARIVGSRCLVVVRPTEPADRRTRLVSLNRGPQLDALISELAGEFPSISLWNESTEDFVKQSFLSPELRIEVTPPDKAVVTLDEALFQQLHGAAPKVQRDSLLCLHSEMVQLVSEVTGWHISFVVAQ